MGCGIYWQQINRLDKSMDTMRMHGILPGAGPFDELSKLRGKLMGQVGIKLPRTTSFLTKLIALSPGSITLWHDVESGFMSEARASPGAPPVYKAVSNEVAMALLKKELTRELEEELMTPDEYLGE